MPDIEDDLKLQNWLSVLTFDAYKYARAGGAVVAEWTEAGLVLHLPGVHLDTDGVHSKLRKMTESAPELAPAPSAPHDTYKIA